MLARRLLKSVKKRRPLPAEMLCTLLAKATPWEHSIGFSRFAILMRPISIVKEFSLGYFVRDIEEGDFKMKQYYTFNQFKRTVKTDKGKVHEVPVGVQDMISAFYHARTFDFSDAEPNQVYEMHIFIDNELWPLRIRYLKKETNQNRQRHF